jgi:hypothetical protein
MHVKPGKALSSDIGRSIWRQKRSEDDIRMKLIKSVADGLNKDQHKKLREVLAIQPTDGHRDARGDTDKLEDIFVYAPKNFEGGVKVPHELAKMILRNAISEAIILVYYDCYFGCI